MANLNHIIIPVAFNCDQALFMNRAGNRVFSYPFDWTVNKYDFIFKVFDQGIDGLLDDFIIGDLTYTSWYIDGKNRKTGEFRTIYDKNYQVFLVHDYYKGVTIEDIKNKYTRRYNRMIEQIKVAEKITLVGCRLSERYQKKLEDIYIKRTEISFKNDLTEQYTLNDIETLVSNINPQANIKLTEPLQK